LRPTVQRCWASLPVVVRIRVLINTYGCSSFAVTPTEAISIT
jgi:hypothetical protein